MSGHGHGHGGHHHGCCEDEHEAPERGVEYALYLRIDLEKMQCLNESRDGDGKLVFKPWDQRTDREKVSGLLFVRKPRLLVMYWSSLLRLLWCFKPCMFWSRFGWW